MSRSCSLTKQLTVLSRLGWAASSVYGLMPKYSGIPRITSNVPYTVVSSNINRSTLGQAGNCNGRLVCDQGMLPVAQRSRNGQHPRTWLELHLSSVDLERQHTTPV